MAFYAAFWSKSYWYEAYQTLRSDLQPTPDNDNGWLGGGYVHPYEQYREEEYRREQIRKAQAELKRVEEELAEAEAEKQRLEALKKAKKKAAKDRAALLLLQEQEISRLRTERIWLMRQIDESEALLVLSMMARRRRFSFLAFN